MRHWNREHLSAGRASINEFFGDEFEVGSHGNVVTTDRGRNLINLAGYGVNLLGGLHPRVKPRPRPIGPGWDGEQGDLRQPPAGRRT